MQMTNIHFKRCWTSLIVREMQIKTTMRYHLTPVRMAIIKKNTNNKCWWGCTREVNFIHCWWECKLVQPLWKTVWQFLKKTKNRTTIWPKNSTLGYIPPKKAKILIWKCICMPMFIAALFTIAKICKQPVSINRWMHKEDVCVCVCVSVYVCVFVCISVQFSDQVMSNLCDPMDCSPPGPPVPHHLPEFAQVHVHWIGDVIQPSHLLPSSCPFVFNLSQHQSLFQWVSSSYQVAKVLELQLQHQSFQWVLRVDFP